jgi:hypothetical protein
VYHTTIIFQDYHGVKMAAQAAQTGMGIAGDVMSYGTTAGALGTATDVQNQGYAKSIAGMLGQQQSSQAAWNPYQQLGLQGIQGIKNIGQDISSDPAFQFAVGQGTNVMNQQAGARGHYFAPQTMEALTAYGQNIGNEWYQQAFQNQMAQVGVGQQATGMQTQQGFNMQNMLNQLYQGQSGMQASSAMAGAANQNQLIGGIQGSLSGGGGGMNQMMGMFGGGSSANTGGMAGMTPSMAGGGK